MDRFRSGLLAAFLAVAGVVALGATYTYSRKEAAETISGAWNYIALVTLGAGANASGGGSGGALTVSAGSGVGFEGQSGDTYTKRNADTTDLETYKDGVVAERNRGTSWMPPECPVIVGDMGLGFCYDQATGKIKVKDAAGVRDL